MDLLRFFRKKEKRNTWIPWSSAISDQKARYLSGNLSQIRRAMQLYANLLITTPLEAIDKDGKEVDHYLFKVLEKPARFLSKAEFYTRLVESYFLEGNFYCLIESNGNGKITSLLPFLPGTCYAYAKGIANNGAGDHSDPVTLNQNGSYHYMSQFGEGKASVKRTYSPEDIWHLKSTWQSSDLLNGSSLYEAYTETISQAQDTLDTGASFSQSGMIPPSIISGIGTETPEEKQSIQNAIQTFFDNKGRFLTLPEGVKVEELLANNPSAFLQTLASISSLNIARLMSVPIQLIEREDGIQASGGGQNLKETFRFWVKTSGRGFLKIIEEKLNELVYDVTFKFRIKSVQSSDMRELAMSVNQLIQAGAITPEEAREWLKE